MVSRVNLEQMDVMPDYISALGAASIPHGARLRFGEAHALSLTPQQRSFWLK